MLIPLGALAVGAVFAGMFFRHWFIGTGFEGFWKDSLFIAKDNKILEEMENVPWLVSLLPFLMMAAGFVVAYYMYMVTGAPRRGSRAAIRCSTASCSTSGISTSSTISCSCGPRSGSAGCSGRAATAR